MQARVPGARRHSNHADRGSQADRVSSPQRAASLLPAMKTIDAARARQLAWLALGVYLAGLGISATLRAQGDFNVYYRAGHRVLHHLAIYPPDDSDRFLYAPIFSAGVSPLAGGRPPLSPPPSPPPPPPPAFFLPAPFPGPPSPVGGAPPPLPEKAPAKIG